MYERIPDYPSVFGSITHIRILTTPTMMKVIVIEDEYEGMDHILRLLKNNLPNVEVVGTGRTNADLLKLIEDESIEPDVLVLDIQLPDGQVFQSLDLIDTSNMSIIFTTAYNEYAVQAFEKAAIHYLLKPITKEKLILAFQRIQKAVSTGSEETKIQLEIAKYFMELGPNAIERTGIGSVEGVRFVNYRDIIRLEGDDTYTSFIMVDGERIIVSKNIGFFVTQYEKFNFVKTHQTHLVNFNHMSKYIRGDGGLIIMDNGDEVPLSRRNRPKFLEKLKEVADLLV